MLKAVEDISATKKRLSIEIPAEAIEGEIANSLNFLRKKTRVPGFRQGRAPMAIIEKRFGKDAEAEAVEKVIPQFYSAALKEADITPVTRPVIEGGVEFERKKPLSLTFTVEIRPRIENLRYEGITVKDIPVAVSDSDVEDALTRLQAERATYEPSGEPVGEGDLVTLDYEVEGRAFEDQVLQVGGAQVPAEFSQNLLGLGKSETKEFTASFPEGFPVQELAGGSPLVKVSVKEIKRANLPAIDDEFARDLEFDDLAALKGRIRERLEASRKEAASNIMKAEVMKGALDAHSFEAPESLVEEDLSYRVAEARAQGRKEDDGALREEFRAAAEKNIRASLLIQMVGEKENVEVTEEDMRERIAALAGRLRLSPENVIKYYVSRDGSLEGLRQSIFEDKVLGLLLERAEVVKED